jgi:hypothetical protein
VEAPSSVKLGSGGIAVSAGAEEIRQGRGPATTFEREGGIADSRPDPQATLDPRRRCCSHLRWGLKVEGGEEDELWRRLLGGAETGSGSSVVDAVNDG